MQRWPLLPPLVEQANQILNRSIGIRSIVAKQLLDWGLSTLQSPQGSCTNYGRRRIEKKKFEVNLLKKKTHTLLYHERNK